MPENKYQNFALPRLPWSEEVGFDCGYGHSSSGIADANGEPVAMYDPSEGEYAEAIPNIAVMALLLKAGNAYHATGLFPDQMAQMLTWQPIADAPRDGTRYLATDGKRRWVENRPSDKHVAGDWEWIAEENGGHWAGGSVIRGATHFMPIQPAPQGTEPCSDSVSGSVNPAQALRIAQAAHALAALVRVEFEPGHELHDMATALFLETSNKGI